MTLWLSPRVLCTAVAVLALAPVLAAARPSNGQRNYGILGNVVVWLIESFRNKAGLSASAEAPMKAQAPRRTGGKWPSRPSQQHVGGSISGSGSGASKGERQRSYGPIGNLIVYLMESTLGEREPRPVGVEDADARGAVRPFIVAPDAGLQDSSGHSRADDPTSGTIRGTSGDVPKPSDDANKPQEKKHSGSKRLRGLRELIRVLWSNFLPDPTFDLAVEKLKASDRLGVDPATGSGFVTLAQRERLAAAAGGASVGSKNLSCFQLGQQAPQQYAL